MAIDEKLLSFASRLRATLDAVNAELAAKGAAEAGDYSELPASVRSIKQGATLPTQEKSVSPSADVREVVPDEGYTLSKVTVGAAPLESGSATPAASAKTYYPASGKYGFSQFKVNAIPSGALSSPEITVSSSGLITAKGGVSAAGYLASGATKSNTKQLSAQSGGTYTLGAGETVEIEAGTFLTSKLSVKGRAARVSTGAVSTIVAGEKTIKFNIGTSNLAGFVLTPATVQEVSVSSQGKGHIVAVSWHEDGYPIVCAAHINHGTEVLRVFNDNNACSISVGSSSVTITASTDYYFYNAWEYFITPIYFA